MTWSPEYTAPFDIPVLVYSKPHIAVAVKLRLPRHRWHLAESFGFSEDGEIYEVTHWQPLPELPE